MLFRSLNAQSTSVFDANYFNKDNTTPPIKIGKGFHMTDIYKQTRSCFTAESANSSKLTAQQVGGKKTNIRLFYTKDNEEFNTFKSRGATGKVSYLSLFSMGGQKLEEFTNKVIKDEERLIFAANVDFGIYSFDTDPTLTPEAQELIKQKQLQDFVKMYGTHYISGIRKESNITVIMTKTSSNYDTEENSSYSIEAGGDALFNVKGSFELENRNSTNTFISENEFSVTVEINGPAIDQNVLQNKINAVLEEDIANKSDAIAEIIGSTIRNISDPAQSLITQYYYSPFSLYGLDGIFWDEKKQNQLVKINEVIIDVYAAKSQITEIISPSGKEQLDVILNDSEISEDYIEKITRKYNDVIPPLKSLDQVTSKYLLELEKRYNNCANVFCANNSECCNNEEYITEIKAYDFNTRIKTELSGLMELIMAGTIEVLIKPECEKQEKGIITINNVSTNPYSIYIGNVFVETLQGNTSLTYYADIDTHYIKAVQKSGYMIYATENTGTARITEICQEVTLNVGYE